MGENALNEVRSNGNLCTKHDKCLIVLVENLRKQGPRVFIDRDARLSQCIVHGRRG